MALEWPSTILLVPVPWRNNPDPTDSITTQSSSNTFAPGLAGRCAAKNLNRASKDLVRDGNTQFISE